MSQITREQLLRLAQLSALRIADSDIEQRLKEMNDVLSYVDAMNQVAQNAPAASDTISALTPMHDDTPRPSMSMDKVMKNAPDHQEVFFRVPRMIGD